MKPKKAKKRKAVIALERRTRHLLRKFLVGFKVKKRKSKRAKLGSRTPRQMSAF